MRDDEDEVESSKHFEIGESSGIHDKEEDQEELVEIIVEDLIPFVDLCEKDSDDYDFDFPPGYEPDLNYIQIEEWKDSDDELHPEGIQNERSSEGSYKGFWIESSDEEEPEIKNAPQGIEEQEQKFPWWFPQTSEPTNLKIKKFFKIPRRNCVGRILSWKYDNDNKVIIIKRTDGLQYFPRSFKRIGSMPKCEVNHIAQIKMINRSGNGMVKWMEDIFYREFKNGKFVHIPETFPRRVTDYFDIEPISNQPRVHIFYPRVRCLKKIPLEKLPINFDKYISYWRYNGSTGEAEIGCFDRDFKGEIMWARETVVYVYDPLSLINLSSNDLEVLSQIPIAYDDSYDDQEMAMKFQRVVDVCCAQGIHAGGNLPR